MDFAEEMARVFTDPIVLFHQDGDLIPQWLKEKITIDRCCRYLKNDKNISATDSEVCAYLMTASFAMPLDHDYAQIYLYVANKTYKGRGELPSDIIVNYLTSDQERYLDRLSHWIREQQDKHFKSKKRKLRKQNKTLNDIPKQAGQLVLTNFFWR